MSRDPDTWTPMTRKQLKALEAIEWEDSDWLINPYKRQAVYLVRVDDDPEPDDVTDTRPPPEPRR